MISENIEFIKNTFLNYYGNQKYFVLFLIAILFIFINEKHNHNRQFLFYYPIVLLLIILNPLFCFLLFKIIPQNVYYRFFWTIPFGIMIAYFGVRLIDNIHTKLKKNMAAISFILIIIYCGTFIYSNRTFEKVNNWYKIPDEYVQVTQMIGKIPLESKKAVTSVDMIGYIRQIDATINLAYGRNVFGDYEDNYIVKCYNTGNVKCLIDVCQEQNINIIIYDNAIPLTISPAHYGYNLYAQTEHYDIYVFSE